MCWKLNGCLSRPSGQQHNLQSGYCESNGRQRTWGGPRMQSKAKKEGFQDSSIAAAWKPTRHKDTCTQYVASRPWEVREMHTTCLVVEQKHRGPRKCLTALWHNTNMPWCIHQGTDNSKNKDMPGTGMVNVVPLLGSYSLLLSWVPLSLSGCKGPRTAQPCRPPLVPHTWPLFHSSHGKTCWL